MGVIYSILEALIPFEFIDYAFMKNALIAIILVTPVFAILGTMIVNNKWHFLRCIRTFSINRNCIRNGFRNIKYEYFNDIICCSICIVIKLCKNKTNYGADTIISVFSSIAIALGLAMLAQSGNFNKYSSYLVGDILSISNTEILYLF